MLTAQRELVIGLAKLRNEPKGVSFKDKMIIDRLLKVLNKRMFPQNKLDEFRLVYEQILEQFEKEKAIK